MSADAKQLIVVARPEDQAVIKKTLDQIAVSADTAAKLTLEFYQVEGVSPAQLQTLLQPRVVESTITVDAAQERLIVWGPAAEHLAFAEVITKLKEDPLAGTKPVLESYPLSDDTLSTTITSVLATMAPAATVTWDADLRQLRVVATRHDQQVVKETIEQMTKDRPPAEKHVLQAYPFQHGSAKTAFDMLKQLYPTLKLQLDEKNNSVVVNAPLSEQSRIRQAVAQLDVEAAAGNKEELRSYATGKANPTSLVAMLQKLLPDMQITPDLPAQKVIAYGTLADHAELEKALEQFRTGDPAERPTVVVYPVEGRTVDGLAQLRSVITQVVPEAVIGIDARGGSIIVSAQEEDHQEIKAAIAQVVAMDREAESRLETYTLDKLKSTPTLATLRLIAPTAQMSVGAVPEQIVVWGTAEDHERVQAALAKMEETGGADATRELRVHEIPRAPAPKPPPSSPPPCPTCRSSPARAPTSC